MGNLLPFLRRLGMKTRWSHSILLCLLACRTAGAQFDFENVRVLAENLAAQPFKPSSSEIIEPLLNLNYEQYQAIQFIHKKALWREDVLPFQLEFFLPGDGHKQVVLLHQIDDRGARDIVFDSNLFDLGNNHVKLPSNLGYSGFRIVQPVKDFIEVSAFLDASYFRMVGQGQDYGTSARGLALNTVADESEEFPVFQQFWVRRPMTRDHAITVYALMDSRSIAGAYRFIIQPGTATVAVVKAVLFPRREVKQFGIAPLTSMFLYGKNGHQPFTDFRPEVHDADGLLIQNGRGEWIWRPLEAGKMTRVDSFQDDGSASGILSATRIWEQGINVGPAFGSNPSGIGAKARWTSFNWLPTGSFSTTWWLSGGQPCRRWLDTRWRSITNCVGQQMIQRRWTWDMSEARGSARRLGSRRICDSLLNSMEPRWKRSQQMRISRRTSTTVQMRSQSPMTCLKTSSTIPGVW